MRPSSYTNSAETVRRNAPFISVNTAIGVDLLGNVWADFIDPGRYYSGVGGQPDFVRALNDPAYGAPIIAMKSLTAKGASKIVRMHPSGVSPTASAYDGVIIITEYGVADLRELTVGNRALAIASIAHPSVREDLFRYIRENTMFTRLADSTAGSKPVGVTPYTGSVAIEESGDSDESRKQGDGSQ
jgi:acyl-CoA hydrolase